MATPGLFIALEGIDGSGKSTQVERLATHASSLGLDPLVVREPGGTPLGERLRALLLVLSESGGQTPIAGAAEALLYAASRAQLVERVIMPAIDAGRLVIADRFLDSSLAYQGAGRGLGMPAVLAANELAVRDCVPDVTVLVDLEPQAARERLTNTGQAPDRIESEQDDFFETVAAAFRELASADEAGHVVVDGSATPDQVFAQIMDSSAGLLMGALARAHAGETTSAGAEG
jgi:dTMP kinase